MICVSIKIDIMLHCNRFGVQKCRFGGPCWGSMFFTFWGIKSGQEPYKSDCDTIFVDFGRGSKWIDF